MSKLFGDNQTFSAALEVHITDKSGKAHHHARQNFL